MNLFSLFRPSDVFNFKDTTNHYTLMAQFTAHTLTFFLEPDKKVKADFTAAHKKANGGQEPEWKGNTIHIATYHDASPESMREKIPQLLDVIKNDFNVFFDEPTVIQALLGHINQAKTATSQER